MCVREPGLVLLTPSICRHKSLPLPTQSSKVSLASLRQFKAHAEQKLQPIIWYRSIQSHSDPVGLVHVPTGKNPRFSSEGIRQAGIAFEVHYTDLPGIRKSQILSGNIHDDRKPFSALCVAKHLKTRTLGKQIFTGGFSP